MEKKVHIYSFVLTGMLAPKEEKQAGAELCQAQQSLSHLPTSFGWVL